MFSLSNLQLKNIGYDFFLILISKFCHFNNL